MFSGGTFAEESRYRGWREVAWREKEKREFDEGTEFDPGSGFVVGNDDSEVDFCPVNELSRESEIGFDQFDLEAGMVGLHGAKEIRKMVAHDLGRSGESEAGSEATPEMVFDVGQAAEEWGEEGEEVATGVGEEKRFAAEEGEAEVPFEGEDLGGDGGLTDAVGEVTAGAGDAAVFGDVVEEFEVMKVQGDGCND